MTKDQEDILLKCTRPGCGFVTSEVHHNYCPLCGLVLYSFVDGHYFGASMAGLSPKDAKCPMASDCAAIGFYVPECDQEQPGWRCFAAIHQRVESVQYEIRLVRKALEEAGLLVRKTLLRGPRKG
jgi:hypothetical protein